MAEFDEPFESLRKLGAYVAETAKKSDLQRSMDESKTGVETLKELKQKNPYNGKLIPVFISDYVFNGVWYRRIYGGAGA